MTTRVAMALVAALVMASLGGASAAADIKVDVVLGGGTIIDFGHSDETGNAFGGTVLVGVGDFSGGIGVATVLPDSRTQGEFIAWWLEGRWSVLGRDGLLQPYVLIGAGSASDDNFVPGSLAFEPAEWSTAAGLLVMVGGGLRYGDASGIFVAADARLWNLGHLGLSLNAGVTF